MSDVEIIDEGGDNDGKLLAKLPKDSIRSIFHLLAGKPDSVEQIFHRRVLVNQADIEDLNDRVKEKLANHHVSKLVASIDVTFHNNKTLQFGSWEEFRAFRWTGAETTHEVRLTWDFLVSMPEFKIPQRHMLVVKVSSNMDAFDMMHRLFSRDPDERMEALKNDCPIVARVDFINHILSKELLAIVGDWSKALRSPIDDIGFRKFLKNQAEKIQYCVSKLLPVLTVFAILILARFMFPGEDVEQPATLQSIRVAFTWFFGAAVLVALTAEASKKLGATVYRNLRSSSEYTVFQLTKGDENEQEHLNKINKKFYRRFMLTGASSLALNILAGFIVAYFW